MSIFLTVRVLHILLAATWFGAAIVMIYFVMPSLAAAPAGGAVMGELLKRRYSVFMESVVAPGMTVGAFPVDLILP